jgi:hypothetical protein
MLRFISNFPFDLGHLAVLGRYRLFLVLFAFLLDPGRCLLERRLANVIHNRPGHGALHGDITRVKDAGAARRQWLDVPMARHVVKVGCHIVVQLPSQARLGGVKFVVIIGLVLLL